MADPARGGEPGSVGVCVNKHGDLVSNAYGVQGMGGTI